MSESQILLPVENQPQANSVENADSAWLIGFEYLCSKRLFPVSFVAFFLCVAVILCFVSFRSHFATRERQDVIRYYALLEFGQSAEVIEVYSYRSGTKPANYSVNTEAVVESTINKARKKMKISHQAPAQGDIWSLKYNAETDTIELGSLLTHHLPISTEKLPTNSWEEYVKTHPQLASVLIFAFAFLNVPAWFGCVIWGLMSFATIWHLPQFSMATNVNSHQDLRSARNAPFFASMFLLCCTILLFQTPIKHLAEVALLKEVLGYGMVASPMLMVVSLLTLLFSSKGVEK